MAEAISVVDLQGESVLKRPGDVNGCVSCLFRVVRAVITLVATNDDLTSLVAPVFDHRTQGERRDQEPDGLQVSAS